MCKCGYCQTAVAENQVYLDNELITFCSVGCRNRGFNLGVFLQDMEKQDKGWKHRRSYYRAYEVVAAATDQEVWDACLYIFHNFDVKPLEMVLNMERVKNHMRRIHATKRMHNAQRKLLEFFFASTAEEKHTLKRKCLLQASQA